MSCYSPCCLPHQAYIHKIVCNLFLDEASSHAQQRGHQSKPSGSFFVFSHIGGATSSLSFWVIWLFGRPSLLLTSRLRGPSWVSSQICLVWPLVKVRVHTHTHTTIHTHITNKADVCLNINTLKHKLWARRKVRPPDSVNTWIQTAGLMRSDVASGIWNSAFSMDSLNYLQCFLQ